MALLPGQYTCRDAKLGYPLFASYPERCCPDKVFSPMGRKDICQAGRGEVSSLERGHTATPLSARNVWWPKNLAWDQRCEKWFTGACFAGVRKKLRLQ